MFIGRQHPIDHALAIAAAARRHQQELAVIEAERLGGRGGRDIAPQIAGINHPPPHALRQVDAGERIADLRQAIDPDLVVIVAEGRDRVLALPLGFEGARIVHHVAQAEHDRGAARPQQVEGWAHLAAQPQGLLVDDQDVGIEDIGGVAHDRRPHRQGFFNIDVQVERDVLAIPQLDHARDTYKIHPRAEIEAADDRRSR